MPKLNDLAHVTSKTNIEDLETLLYLHSDSEEHFAYLSKKIDIKLTSLQINAMKALNAYTLVLAVTTIALFIATAAQIFRQPDQQDKQHNTIENITCILNKDNCTAGDLTKICIK